MFTSAINPQRDLKVDAISSLKEPRNFAKRESASVLSKPAIHCLHKALLEPEDNLFPQLGHFLQPDLSSLVASLARNKE